MYKKASESQQYLGTSGSFSTRSSRRGYPVGEDNEYTASQLDKVEEERIDLVAEKKGLEYDIAQLTSKLKGARTMYARTEGKVLAKEWTQWEIDRTRNLSRLAEIESKLSKLKKVLRRSRDVHYDVPWEFMKLAEKYVDQATFERWKEEAKLRAEQRRWT